MIKLSVAGSIRGQGRRQRSTAASRDFDSYAGTRQVNLHENWFQSTQALL